MSPSDLIVICAESVSFTQAADLMKWYVQAEPAQINHPSLRWWASKHASQMMRHLECAK